MIPVLTPAEMKAVDETAAAGTEILVSRAGAAVARAALRMMGGGYGRRVVVVAGKGNNGADGRVAAERLRRAGVRVTVVEAAGSDAAGVPGTEAAGASGIESAGASGTSIRAGASAGDAAIGSGTAARLKLPPCDLMIDAAYGTGFRGEYEAPDPGGAPVLAVDIPSGVDGLTGEAGRDAVSADLTITFAALKPGLLLGAGRERAGRVEVVDIGLSVEDCSMHVVEDADVARFLPPRSRDAHKWNAAVFVAAGSPGMTGAPRLVGRGAFRAGAGTVRLGVPGALLEDLPPSEAVGIALPDEDWAVTVLEAASRCKAIVVGPGLGRADIALAEVRRLVAKSPVPLVVDADALGVFADAADVPLAKSPLVLTPHDGEFERLFGSKPGGDRIGDVRTLAERTGATVLLKGPTTVVASPDGEVLLSASGSSRLATAGSGDVLAGVVGAFLAQGLAPLEAAALAAHAHGAAASLGYEHGLLAGDLPELIARWLSELNSGDQSTLRVHSGRKSPAMYSQSRWFG
ncbi:MAG TPA: NAD(P)H-hydrate dehydratase [Acidimicrobiales bacterium]|nr:NAD(P)H-hydrate dehydratase [Acidimicrobiales bacterium]